MLKLVHYARDHYYPNTLNVRACKELLGTVGADTSAVLEELTYMDFNSHLLIFEYMKIRALKYLTTYTLPLAVIFSFTSEGWHTFMPIIYAFGIIPLLELFIKPDARNLSEAEIQLSKSDSMYDLLVWLLCLCKLDFWYGTSSISIQLQLLA